MSSALTMLDDVTADTVERLHRHPALAGRDLRGVEHLDQRSRCTRLNFTDGTSVFVKRATRDAAGRWSADVAHEARVLGGLAARGVAAPRVLAAVDEPDARLVVMEDLSAHRPLDARRREAGGTSVPWAAAAGHALAAVHRDRGDGSADTALASRFVAGLTVLTPRTVSDFPAGYCELAGRIGASGLLPLLDEATAAWRATTLIHGDVKSDNMLCAASPSRAGAARLIDWELAGRGDPRWDVGSLVGDYLFGWLSSMSFRPGATLAEWTASADPPLAAVRAEIRAALAAYQQAHPAADDDRRQWIRYAAIFLLQRAHASAVQTQQLPAHALAFLQVAGRLLRDPDSALETLT